jgi:hypothetical protein
MHDIAAEQLTTATRRIRVARTAEILVACPAAPSLSPLFAIGSLGNLYRTGKKAATNSCLAGPRMGRH